MVDPNGAQRALQPPERGERDSRRRRARALLACALFAVALHIAFLDGFGGSDARAPEAAPMPFSVRTIAVEPPVATGGDPPPAEQAPQAAQPQSDPPTRPVIDKAVRRPPRVSASSAVVAAVVDVDPRSDGSPVMPKDGATAGGAAAAGASAAPQPAVDTRAPSSFPAPIPGIGDQPPPVYPTRLPPPATLHYQVRRGFLRGDGDIRWRPTGDTYRLVLEARFAGLTLLVQTSEGAIDANGLAPVRFLDQRARRAAQAANFVRESGRITFSGTAVEWPILPGSQDRLSWMIQVAAIVAADPGLLHEGGRITMAVVGARGDAAVWSLRYVGEESVETAHGSASAVKLVREGRTAYDTTAEIWLDPARSYLPAHATLRNSSGEPEYELLLDRVEP